MIPKNASGFLMGSYYKVGRHNRLYYWDDEWKRSRLSANEFLKQLSKKKSPFDTEH